jgi:hypothetical protein
MAKATLSLRNDPKRFNLLSHWHEYNPEPSEIRRIDARGNSATAQMFQNQHFQQQIHQQYPTFAQAHQSNLPGLNI